MSELAPRLGTFRNMLLCPLSKHMHHRTFLVSQGGTDGHGTSGLKQTQENG